MTPKVGLNCLHIIPGRLGGLETYMTNLLDDLRELAEQFAFTVFCTAKYKSFFVPWATTFEVAPLPVDVDSTPRRILYEQLGLWRQVRRHRLDVLHSSGYTAPLLASCRTVQTIHDLNYLEIPGMVRRSNGELRFQLIRLLGPVSTRRAHRVVAVSEYVAASVREHLGLSPSRISVVPNRPADGIEHAVPMMPAGLSALQRPYLLYVASYYAHKNHRRLLEALSQVAAESPPPILVLAGLHLKTNADKQALGEEIARAGAADSTIVLDSHLTLNELAWLYRNARCFVFPSLFEGYGIPVVEAMSVGTPVICSRRAPMSEIAASAAEYFDPEDVQQMASVIREVWSNSDRQKALSDAGRRQYQHLRLEASQRARLMSEIYWSAMTA